MKPRAKSLIKDMRETKGVSYKELARRLEAYGVAVDDRVLINRINRGGFSLAFALQVLAALGATSLEVPALPNTSGLSKGLKHPLP